VGEAVGRWEEKDAKKLVVEEYIRGVLRSGDRIVRAGIIGSKQ